VDVTSNLEPAFDEMTASTPSSPTYREGVSIWLWDDAGRFGFPRVGVEAVGRNWKTSFGVALCMGMPDGRLFLVSRDEPPLPVCDGRGRPRVLGAGPLRFESLEPLAHWRITFEGDALAIDVNDFLARGTPRPVPSNSTEQIALTLDVDARMVTPPWVQGTLDPEGDWVAGEQRLEQLCTVTGTVTLGGEKNAFTGGGLRIHRKGGNRSDYRDFYGHNWQSALFPSGRAFGFIHYHPRPDGSVKYREGWLLDEGEIMPARVTETPWMTDTQPSGEDVSFTLHTRKGSVCIVGETFVSSFRPPRPVDEGTTFPLLHSGIAKYRWDNEVAYGMIERSARI
jgi:hypothetical protein